MGKSRRNVVKQVKQDRRSVQPEVRPRRSPGGALSSPSPSFQRMKSARKARAVRAKPMPPPARPQRLDEARRANLPLATQVRLDGSPGARCYHVRIIPRNQRRSVLLLLEPAEGSHALIGHDG